MDQNHYTLDELSTESGVEPRTIRSYIQQGLMRGPEALGRNAFYVPYHLNRLRNIKLLKDLYGLQMREIRRLLMTHGDNDIDPQALSPKSPQIHGPGQSANSALDFIRSVKALGSQSKEVETDQPLFTEEDSVPYPALPDSESGPSPLSSLLEALKHGLSEATVPRRTRGESWVRIEITPDVYFTVRGNLDVQELARFEQVADIIRQYLAGGIGRGPGNPSRDCIST